MTSLHFCLIAPDDILVYISDIHVTNANARLQSCVNLMASWFNINKLTVNTDKTYTMLISSQSHKDKDAPLSININGIPLVQRNEVILTRILPGFHKLVHFPDYDTFYHINHCILFILVSYFHP